MSRCCLIPAGALAVVVGMIFASAASGGVLLGEDGIPNQTLAWSEPVLVDNSAIVGVSCPSESFCAAADSAGQVLTSTNPTGGSGAWSAARVDAGNLPLLGVSCPSASLCAVLDQGEVLTSTNPIGGAGAWAYSDAVAELEDPVHPSVGAISCPSASLCVAGDGEGDILTSTNPTGGPGSWTLSKVDPEVPGEPSIITGISCPSASLCVATDWSGRVLTSTNPTGGAPAWSVASVNSGSHDPATESALLTVSCQSASLCVALDSHGSSVLTSSNPTGGAGAWHLADIGDEGSPIFSVSCPSPSLCVVGGWGRYYASTDPLGGGGAWPRQTIPDAGFSSLSCPPSASSCEVPTTDVLFVSCPSASLCVAGDMGGKVLFAKPSRMLSVRIAGDASAGFVRITGERSAGFWSPNPGGVFCPSACDYGFLPGGRATVTASATKGSFAGWSGGGCGGSATCTVTMDADTVLTATFKGMATQKKKPRKCKKGFRRKRVKGKVKCVRSKKRKCKKGQKRRAVKGKAKCVKARHRSPK